VKILVADDDRVFQLILAKTLPQWGFDPLVVDNGEDAWLHLGSPDGPSIAILDWVMPRADGLEVCRRVRSCGLARYVYLILLTSNGASEELMSGLEAGADDYLSKPVNPDVLRLRLRAGCRVVESERRHRHIAENASDGIVTMEDGNRIQFANSSAGAIFGYERAELTGLDFATLVPEFERHLAAACFQRTADRNDGGRLRSCNPFEVTGKQRTGCSIVLEVSFSESKHSEHGYVRTAMIRDVTERRRLEGQRTQKQKLESIGQLAAGVAHEINTPIQYIGDNLQFLEESFASLHPALEIQRQLYREVTSGPIEAATVAAMRSVVETVDFEYLERETPSAITQALEGVHQVADIVRALKEFAHPGTAEMVPTDLNHLIESTVLLTRNHWNCLADLTLDLDPGLPLVACVAGEISQVTLDLIVNAADAIKDALRERPGARGKIIITTRVAGGCAEVRISDSGMGIPFEVRSKIFDPFFTTKDVGQGSGQALALAYASVVQKHHGALDFVTTVGAGTTFVVRLPLSAKKAYVAYEGKSHEIV